MDLKFLDRKKEFEILKSLSNRNFFLVVKGRRRIGKTTFLKKYFSDAVYIFIWPNKSIDWILEETCKQYSFPSFKKFNDLINYLLDNNKKIIIDEFQNFLTVDKSIYGELQKTVDERKKKFLKISVAGSSNSLMTKVFNSSASPLYGRKTAEITLTHLPIKDLFISLKIPIEEFITFWAVFQGAPYYYELLESKNASKEVKRLFFSRNSLLREEGKAVMNIEFEEQSKTYNTVLSAIAEGKTKLNEIASMFGNKKNEAIKYISVLRKEFKLVRRITPILSNPKKSKEGIYELTDNLLEFWFYFIDKQRSFIEQDREEELNSFFEKNFDIYLGKKFEKFIIELIKNKILFNDLKIEKIGRQWWKIKKEVFEIDILCLTKKKTLFCECKWKNKVDSEKIASNILNKIKKMNIDGEKEIVIFAKEFSKKIKIFEGIKVQCISIKNLAELILTGK